MYIDWDNTQVALKQVGRVHCAPGWTLDASWSQRLSDFDLWFICEGMGEMDTHQGRIALRPGMCFWMRPGGRYHATQSPRDRLTVAYAHFDLLDNHGRIRDWHKPLPPELLPQVNASLVDQIHRRIYRTPRLAIAAAAQTEHDPAAIALFRGLLMDLDAQSHQARTSTIAGTQLHHQQIVQQLALKMTEHPGDDHNIQDMAREAGYSPDHFSRVFKEVLGQSPQAYAISARMTRARELLRESSLSVSQIADALGYEDVAFFSRQFKSRTGRSPAQFRHASDQQA